jgi:hypothetical protein
MDELTALDGPELFIGLVGAVGTDLAAVSRVIKEQLEKVNYTVEEIRASTLLYDLDKYAALTASASGSEDADSASHAGRIRA